MKECDSFRGQNIPRLLHIFSGSGLPATLMIYAPDYNCDYSVVNCNCNHTAHLSTIVLSACPTPKNVPAMRNIVS